MRDHLATGAAARALQGAAATLPLVADGLAGMVATVQGAPTDPTTLERQILAGHLSSVPATEAAVVP